MLLDILMLVVGMALLLIGLQETFLDPEKRKIPKEVIKATFIMVTGLFLINFWYTSVSLSKGNTYTSG